MEEKPLIVCPLCAKKFAAKRYLKEHQKKFHPETITRKVLQHACGICGKYYNHKKNLSDHQRRKHPEVIAVTSDITSRDTVHCKEEECTASFSFISQLRNHLVSSHGIVMEHDVVAFTNKEECLLWIKILEDEHSCTFINSTGTKRDGNGGTRTYYYCNRGGVSNLVQDPKRRRRSQGSAKIDHHCTASVIMRADDKGAVKADFYLTHYKHDSNLAHVKLSKFDKQNIAGKLSMGVSPADILDNVRCRTDSNSRRLSLLTKKDIHNIAAAAKLAKHNGEIGKGKTSATDSGAEAQHVFKVTRAKNKSGEKLASVISITEACLVALKSGMISSDMCDLLFPHIMSVKAVLEKVQL